MGIAIAVSGERSVELDSVSRLTFYTTASLAAAAFEDVTGMTITFTPRDRPVLLMAGAGMWQCANAAARPRLHIRKSDDTFIAATGYNASGTGPVAGPALQRRLALGTDITQGVAVTFKLSLQNATGATASTITLLSEDSGLARPFLRAVEL